jgi:DNA-binding FrmR family transcriptional regulator
VRAALRWVEEEVLREHFSHCAEHAIVSGDAAEQQRTAAELIVEAYLTRQQRPSGKPPIL